LFSLAWREAAALAVTPETSLLWQLKGPVLYTTDGRGSFWVLVPSRRIVAVRLSKTAIADPRASVTALLPLLGVGEAASQPVRSPVAKNEAASQPAEDE
jgi:hypothetical protein